MRSAKIPIPAASRRGITEFFLRNALPQRFIFVASHGESTHLRL
ncbi:hypothetical protein AVDCRST_MAG94-6698, partial [uncultured Leptolyngbya sp.]